MTDVAEPGGAATADRAHVSAAADVHDAGMDSTDSAGRDPADAASHRRYRLLQGALTVISAGPALILVALIVIMTFLSPVFLTTGNIGNVLSQTAVIAVLAIGQLLAILTRGIDLSVGPNLALASVIGAIAFQHGQPGFVVIARDARLRRRGRLRERGRLRVGTSAASVHHHVGDVEHRPGSRAATGRWAAATRHAGGSAHARRRLHRVAAVLDDPGGRHRHRGRRALLPTRLGPVALRRRRQSRGRAAGGIPVGTVLISVYVLCGLLAGVGAIITSGRLNAGSPTAGELAELDSIAAVIIGGASFLGGRGTVLNALIGALMIGVIRNGMNLLNVSAFYQLIAIGVVIVIAVEADVVRTKLEERFRVLQATVA